MNLRKIMWREEELNDLNRKMEKLMIIKGD
jgi:hypothetical protein